MTDERTHGQRECSIGDVSGCDRAPGCARGAGYVDMQEQKMAELACSTDGATLRASPTLRPTRPTLACGPFSREKKKIQSSLVYSILQLFFF